MRFENDGSQREVFSDCFFTDGFVLWMGCSCIFSYSDSFYFSEIDGLLLNEVVVVLSLWIILKTRSKSEWKGLSSCALLLPMGSSILVISVTDCCINVLVFFLINIFFDFGMVLQQELKMNPVVF